MTERVLPTGTVTFPFSDMEGSTRLVQDVGPVVLTRIVEQHNALIRAAVAEHGAEIERGSAMSTDEAIEFVVEAVGPRGSGDAGPGGGAIR